MGGATGGRGGPGTGGSQYTTLSLEQPWDEEEERVRIFPPCQVKESVHRGGTVMVFVKSGKIWKRQRVGHYDVYPFSGFIAWDDKNEEYAWHEVGTIDVPSATDPDLPKTKPLAEFKPIIRGESEIVGGKAEKTKHPRDKNKTLRQRFTDWWDGKSRPNDGLDFLRKDKA